jgi:hypothetical protein
MLATQDVSTGEFGTAKLRLEADGLFIKVDKIHYKFMINYCRKSTYLNLSNQIYMHRNVNTVVYQHSYLFQIVTSTSPDPEEALIAPANYGIRLFRLKEATCLNCESNGYNPPILNFNNNATTILP